MNVFNYGKSSFGLALILVLFSACQTKTKSLLTNQQSLTDAAPPHRSLVSGSGLSDLINFAPQGTAAQSSSPYMGRGGPDGSAPRAIDGNTDGDWANGSVTHTNLDPQSWWELDLGAEKQAQFIQLFSRTDCCGDRFNDYYVLLSQTPFLSSDLNATLGQAGVTKIHSSTALLLNSGAIHQFQVDLSFRYLRVQLVQQNYLSLAEVQVLGPPSIPGWTYCAGEGGQCSFSGTREVQYGANGVFVSRVLNDGTSCNNTIFGDPLQGTVKACYYRSSGTEIPGWTYCADEGGQCSFSGAQEVQYGANGVFVSRVLTDGTSCNNTIFGDPLPGTVKACYYRASGSDWFQRAQYGVEVTWTSLSAPAPGQPSKSYCDSVRDFDVGHFAQQLSEAGAGYVIVSISHATMYFAFPSAKLDSILPGRTCSRDLYADLYAALAPRGIRMMFYYPNIAVYQDPEWTAVSRFNTDLSYFNHLQYDIVREVSLRYGSRLSGWWVDNAWQSDPSIYPPYVAALRAGNASSVVGFNFSSVLDWHSELGRGVADFQAGEGDNLDRRPSSQFSGEGGTQWHNLVWMDDFWFHECTDCAPPTPRYSNATVIEYVKDVISHQGVFSYNAAPYQDGRISDETMQQLRVLKAAIRDGVTGSDSGWVKINDGNIHWNYSGSWNTIAVHGNDASPYYDRTGKYTNTPGSAAEYTFHGTDVKWYGVVGTDHGKADVYLDGIKDAEVDLWSSEWTPQKVVYSRSGLSNESHTIRIVARTDRNPSSTNSYVEIDALEYLH